MHPGALGYKAVPSLHSFQTYVTFPCGFRFSLLPAPRPYSESALFLEFSKGENSYDFFHICNSHSLREPQTNAVFSLPAHVSLSVPVITFTRYTDVHKTSTQSAQETIYPLTTQLSPSRNPSDPSLETLQRK